MTEISYLLSHFNAMCGVHNICVIYVKPAEGCNLLGAFESALCRSTLYFQSSYF